MRTITLATATAALTTAAAKQVAQLAVEVLPQFIQIGRPLLGALAGTLLRAVVVLLVARLVRGSRAIFRIILVAAPAGIVQVEHALERGRQGQRQTAQPGCAGLGATRGGISGLVH